MGFKQKSKVTVEDLCFHFYESTVFELKHRSLLTRACIHCGIHRINEDDAVRILSELFALQIELFALALWFYALKRSRENRPFDLDIDRTESILARQVNFTKAYLSRKVELEELYVWEAMAHYNTAIFELEAEQSLTAWFGDRMSTDTAMRFESEDDWLKFGREELATRVKIATRFADFASDKECAERIINIAISDEDWWHSGVIPQGLASLLVERLGLADNLTVDIFKKLERVVLGLYEIAADFIETKPFTPESGRRLAEARELMERWLKEKETRQCRQ